MTRHNYKDQKGNKEFEVIVPDTDYHQKALQVVLHKLGLRFVADIHFVFAAGALIESSRRRVGGRSWHLFMKSTNSGEVILRRNGETGIPVIPVTPQEFKEMGGLAFLAK